MAASDNRTHELDEEILKEKEAHVEKDLFDDNDEKKADVEKDLFDDIGEKEAHVEKDLFDDIVEKEAHIEKDLFDDIGEGGDLFDEPEHDIEKEKEDEYAGIEIKTDDLFGHNDKQSDLFDDDDDDDKVDNSMPGIPVRTNTDLSVPYNTPAVGCVLDEAKTTALLTAAKETTQQKLDMDNRKIINGDAKKSQQPETEVSIISFTRIEEGYSSYIVYTIQTTTNVAGFNRPELTVQRRFSDFVVLHQLLMENYLPRGIIVPPSPEKNFMGTAKVRFGGNNTSNEEKSEFIRRRKAALERYLNRLMAHHLICKDETLRRFLQEEESPRPNPNASGIKGFMKNVETMVNRATAKINEVDEWYEDKQQHILELEETLKKLLVIMDNTVANRRDLSSKSNVFSSSCQHLGEGEDNTSLRHAVTKLSELQTKLETVHLEQTDSDLFVFGETVKDYIAIIQSAKAAFDERVRTFSTWENAQSTLAKKREAKNRATAQGKADKVAQCEEDIKFWENRVERCQEDFELISKNLKDEIKIFEDIWIVEIKSAVTLYFQKMIEHQKLVVGHWKEFLPEAKTIN